MSTSARFLLLSLGVGLGLTACSQVRVVDRDEDSDGDPPPSSSANSPICGDAEALRLSVLAQNSNIEVAHVAPLPGCEMVVVGDYAGAVDFAGIAANATTWDGFVARFDDAGSVVWLLPIGTADAYGDRVHGVTTDEQGNLYVTGRVDEPTTVGALTVDGDYLLALDLDGTPRWSRDLDIAAWGLTVRDGALDALTSVGQGGVGRLRMDLKTGELLTEEVLVTGSATLFDASTRGDTTALAFTFYGTVEAFGQSLTAHDDGLTPVDTQGIDMALAVFEADGTLRWLRTFDEHGFSPYLGRVALGPDGSVALAFDYWGQIDLGAGQHVAAPVGPGMAGLLSIFDATGQVRVEAEYGAGEFVFPSSMAWDASGTLTLAGELYNASLGLGDREIATEQDEYLGFEGAFDSAGALLHAAPRPGFDRMFQAEPGVLFWMDRPTPDGVHPHLIEVHREGVLPSSSAQ